MIRSICFVLHEKYMGRRHTGEGFFSSFIKIRERHRDIKEHSNNKVIIIVRLYNIKPFIHD